LGAIRRALKQPSREKKGGLLSKELERVARASHTVEFFQEGGGLERGERCRKRRINYAVED